MRPKNIETYFFFTALLLLLGLVFYIFRPFLYPLVLAAVFVTIFGPMHRRILGAVRGKGFAALISTILVFIIVVIPIGFLGFQVTKEVSVLYSNFRAGDQEQLDSFNRSVDSLLKYSPVPINLDTDVHTYLDQALAWLLEHLGQIFLNIATGILDTFIFLVALYYLFKDGQRMKKAIVFFSPLDDVHDETIISKLGLAIKSVVGGNIIVGIVQGILIAVGFTIFGIPNPVLWGSFAAIASLVPTLGTSIVTIPGIIYLLFQGHILYAVGLMLWGLTAVGLVDNLLGPKLIGRGLKIHPLLVLLAVLGGIILFGPLGFILGPLVLALLGALIDIYFIICKEKVDL